MHDYLKKLPSYTVLFKKTNRQLLDRHIRKDYI